MLEALAKRLIQMGIDARKLKSMGLAEALSKAGDATGRSLREVGTAAHQHPGAMALAGLAGTGIGMNMSQKTQSPEDEDPEERLRQEAMHAYRYGL